MMRDRPSRSSLAVHNPATKSGRYSQKGNARNHSERGAFMLYLGIGVAILLAVLAFAIDIPQKEVVSHELRLAMDSAALAGAQKLNGTVSGLELAVDAIDQAISKNIVAGRALTESQYQIELGFYSFADKTFRLIANGDLYRNLGGAAPPQIYEKEVPAPVIINAVRVFGSAQSQSIFAGIFGATSLGTVKGDATATASNNPKVCAFPFAIPLCSLFVNHDPNDIDKVISDEYQPERQCKRPLFIANSNYGYEDDGAIGEQMKTDRWSGFARASYYSRPERINLNATNRCRKGGGMGSNCLHAPLVGTFISPIARDLNADGRADGDSDNKGLTVDRFISLMLLLKKGTTDRSDERCINFQIGEIVSPLENSKILKPSGGIVDTIMSSEINGAGDANTIDHIFSYILKGAGSIPFTQAYGNPRASPSTAKPNYPFLRDSPLDRLVGSSNVRVLTPSLGSWEWTNPLCHSSSMPANDLGAAKALRVVVPVIVPHSVGSGALPYQYCNAATEVGTDWRVLAVPPRKETEPQIVGFIEAYVHDFNFRWLQKLDGSENISFQRAPYTDDNGIYRSNDYIKDQIPLGGGYDG